MSEDAWFYAGLVSSFRDITESAATSNGKLKITNTTSNSDERIGLAPCRIFESSKALSKPCELSTEDSLGSIGLNEQILVFRYRGKFHAIDHKCPHRSYALSRGTMHDIEDFGIVLSAGITCPKHGWSFDIHTGESDRNPYQLPIHETQIRKRRKASELANQSADTSDVDEVWVRRRTSR